MDGIWWLDEIERGAATSMNGLYIQGKDTHQEKGRVYEDLVLHEFTQAI
jgi:hypothetical protein